MIKLWIFGSIDLRGDDGAALHALLTQQHATALLAYMAAARSETFFRRDRLVGMLWPESDQGSARTNLRKALYQIRDAIGKEALVARGDEEIALTPGVVWCDVADFEDAFRNKYLERALELYERGQMLDAFNLPNAPGFESWVSETRARLADMAAAASWRMAEVHQGNEEYTEAGRWARRTVAFRPDDERQLRNALTLLDQNGDRAGAVAVYKRFSEWLKRELDVEPSRETQLLIERIKKR
jgi:DNA-binding SARP family transcriptional activator